MTLTRRACLIGGGLFLTAGASRIVSALQSDDRVVGGRAFGTYWRLTLPADADQTTAVDGIEAIIRSVNRAMSPFERHSEITRFNRRQSQDWFTVSRPVHDVVAESQRVFVATGGAFDPTVGPIVGRYGFGPIRGAGGGSCADITRTDRAIRKANPDLTLDLCGIAKGHALDRIVAALDHQGLPSFLIELGGEVFGRGRRWKIGIENPLPGPASIQSISELDGLAVATSGHRHGSFEVRNHRYSHIVDPGLSRPIDRRVASVSVLAPTAMEADAFATGFMVMGPERGGELAERMKMPALFLLDESSGVRAVAVAGFENYVLA